MSRGDSSSDAESEHSAEDEGQNPLDVEEGSDSDLEAWEASVEDEFGDSTDDEPGSAVASHALLPAGVVVLPALVWCCWRFQPRHQEWKRPRQTKSQTMHRRRLKTLMLVKQGGRASG